jgi:hypothetical protein
MTRAARKLALDGAPAPHRRADQAPTLTRAAGRAARASARASHADPHAEVRGSAATNDGFVEAKLIERISRPTVPTRRMRSRRRWARSPPVFVDPHVHLRTPGRGRLSAVVWPAASVTTS